MQSNIRFSKLTLDVKIYEKFEENLFFLLIGIFAHPLKRNLMCPTALGSNRCK